MKKYYERLIESKIEKKLKTSGAVLVTGPKFSGKTTTCRRFQKSNISLIDDNLIKIVSIDPSIALKGEFPRLIDEWQNIPNLWNPIRKEVDVNGTFGEYILTGSATHRIPKKSIIAALAESRSSGCVRCPYTNHRIRKERYP